MRTLEERLPGKNGHHGVVLSPPEAQPARTVTAEVPGCSFPWPWAHGSVFPWTNPSGHLQAQGPGMCDLQEAVPWGQGSAGQSVVRTGPRVICAALGSCDAESTHSAHHSWTVFLFPDWFPQILPEADFEWSDLFKNPSQEKQVRNSVWEAEGKSGKEPRKGAVSGEEAQSHPDQAGPWSACYTSGSASSWAKGADLPFTPLPTACSKSVFFFFFFWHASIA